MPSLSRSTVFTGFLSASAGEIAVGDCLVLNAGGTGFVKASSTNRTAAGRPSAGVALTAGSGTTNRAVEIQFCGLLENSTSNLGAGAAGPVYVSSTGVLTRTVTTEAVGTCDADGVCYLLFGDQTVLSASAPGAPDKSIQYRASATTFGGEQYWTRESAGRVNITASGYITYGAVGDTFPTTGFIRAGSSIGANVVVAPLLTWVRASLGSSLDLIKVEDISSTSATVYYGGASGADSVTFFSGATAKIQGTNQIWLQAAEATGAWGCGSTVISNNVGLCCTPSTPSSTNFKGGSGIIFIGNGSTQATSAPVTGLFMSCFGSRILFNYTTGEQVTIGGCSDDNLGSSNRNYVASVKASNSASYAARSEMRSRSSRVRSGTYSNEETTTSTTPQAIIRYDMANETFCAFSYQVVMVRGTNATKAGRYSGKVSYRRTSAGAPTIVGAASYDTDVETTAGDGVAFSVSSNEIQVVITAADTDTRLWAVELHVHEVAST